MRLRQSAKHSTKPLTLRSMLRRLSARGVTITAPGANVIRLERDTTKISLIMGELNGKLVVYRRWNDGGLYTGSIQEATEVLDCWERYSLP